MRGGYSPEECSSKGASLSLYVYIICLLLPLHLPNRKGARSMYILFIFIKQTRGSTYNFDIIHHI